jgi:hypothetical protein
MTDAHERATTPARHATPAAQVAYRVVLAIFLLLGIIQIFLAGLGVFSLMSPNGGPGFELHRTTGFIMSGVALVILVLAVLARAGARAVGISVLILVLTGVVQSLLAALGEETAFYGGLHALDGLLAIGLAGHLLGTSRGDSAPVSRR